MWHGVVWFSTNSLLDIICDENALPTDSSVLQLCMERKVAPQVV